MVGQGNPASNGMVCGGIDLGCMCRNLFHVDLMLCIPGKLRLGHAETESLATIDGVAACASRWGVL